MKTKLGVAAGALGLALVPFALSSYQLGLLTKMLIFALFAMSLDLVLGYGGLPSLGHAAYFGVGAYTVGLLALRVIDNFWIDFGAGLVAAAVTAALFGLLALRARGAYLLMITLALAQVLWGIAFGWRWLTGGDDGLPGVPRPSAGLPWSLAGGLAYYYFVLVVFLAVTAALWIVVRSPFGMALIGIRESERRMEVLGYDTWRYKYAAFVLAGVVAGLSGNLYVYYNGFVSPAYLSIVFSAMVLIMVILGGAGTLLGPALGGAIIVLLENVVSSSTERWLTVLGVIYVVVTLFAPAGIMGFLMNMGGPYGSPHTPPTRGELPTVPTLPARGESPTIRNV
ncbi:MAG TPA: branched-chain amino acid ABC transporter permease [Candidatus Acidoferrum sp.]|nr:branched-chain amino acid ABC transporter permease [Candidatus Acidoferrum sp.]